jgi:alkylated DNA repair dioxygenase AlkB
MRPTRSVQPVAARLVADGHMAADPDQLLVNEYGPGPGITAHVDCLPCFGPVVCSHTLDSQCAMELSVVTGVHCRRELSG